MMDALNTPQITAFGAILKHNCGVIMCDLLTTMWRRGAPCCADVCVEVTLAPGPVPVVVFTTDVRHTTAALV